jgi:MFS family permease
VIRALRVRGSSRMRVLGFIATLLGFVLAFVIGPYLYQHAFWMGLLLIVVLLGGGALLRARERSKAADREVGHRWFPPRSGS